MKTSDLSDLLPRPVPGRGVVDPPATFQARPQACPRRALRHALALVGLAVGLSLTLASLVGCDFAEPQTASGGTGTEIVGTGEYPPDSATAPKRRSTALVTRTNGLPVASGQVFAYPQSFIPDTSWVRGGALPRAYTDSDGSFRVEDAPRGWVVVQVNDGSGQAVVKSINVTQDSTTYDIGTLTVASTGAIRLPTHTSLSGRVRFYVSVKGTQLVARGSQTGVDLILAGIPSGIPLTINVRVYEPVRAEFNFGGITVSPGLTTLLETLEIK